MALPNAIVIGGTKSGTTALFWYLDEHPEIYMGPRHHIGYFAYAVDESGELLYGDPELHHWPITTLAEYEALFTDAGDAKVVGDVSPIYLETPHAAARIHEMLPTARIICSLRNPVDRAYSDYLMYLRKQGRRRIEPSRDLALSAEWVQPESHWMRLGRYHEQLSRYFDLFPREQLHIFLSQDLMEHTLETVQGVYRFLGVAPDFEPDLSTPHNVGGVPSSMWLERLLTNRFFRSALKPIVPRGFADRLRKLRTSNMDKPPPLPAELRRQMTEHLEEQITKCAGLTGLDLDHWLEPLR